MKPNHLTFPSIKPSWLFLAIIFSLAQFQLVLVLYQAGVGASIQAAKGVVDGTPHWMVFQSRILGPYLLHFISMISGGLGKAYFIFFLMTHAVSGYLALSFSMALFRSRFAAIGAFFAFQALFALVIAPHRSDVLAIYAWDHIGIIIFFVFSYLALSEMGWKSFLVLFVFALLNRESAFFISLWMVSKPIFDHASKRVSRFDFPMFWGGLASFAIGSLVIRFLREKLLIKETMPDLFGKPEIARQSFHFTLDSNLEYLRSTVLSAGATVDFLIPVYILTVFYFSFRLARISAGRYLSLAIVMAAFMASTIAFGVVYEVRVYLEFIPFIVMTTFLLCGLDPQGRDIAET